MGFSAVLIVGFFLAFSLAAPLRSAYAVKAVPSREERWRRDLKQFADELPRRRKNGIFKLSRQEFEQAVAALNSSIPSMTDSEIEAAFIRLAAMMEDGHTYVSWSYDDFRVYPFSLYAFGGGLYVTSAKKEYSRALGARLVAVGEYSADRAIEAIKKMIPCENESCFKMRVPHFLIVHEFLSLNGIIPNREHTRFVFEDASGEQFSFKIRAESASERSERVLLFDSEQNAKPLYLRNRELNYWREYLSDFKTLYIKYNSCEDEKTEPFKKFAEDSISFAASHSVERIVIDLRDNGGGNEGVFRPLIGELRRSPFNKRGRLFAIVGRGTFSAACSNAIELKKKTDLIIVGEPTGEKPNHYGESRSFRLPNSGLEVNYSTKFWKRVEDDPTALMPDVEAVLSYEDFLKGRDPALETALFFTAKSAKTTKFY